MRRHKITAFILACITVLTSFSPALTSMAKDESSDIICGKASVACEAPIIHELTAEEQEKISSGDIQPVVVNDLDEYLKNFDAGTTDLTDCIEDIPTPSTRATMSSKKTIGVNPIPVPPVYINCEFTYTKNKAQVGYYFFKNVSNIKSWLTGIRFPVNFSWKQRRASKSFTSTRRHLTITLTGVLDTYIIVNGIGKILSQNRTYSFNFYLKS